MLVISRKPGESVLIGDDTLIVVTEIRTRGMVRLGLITSNERHIVRSELLLPGDPEFDGFIARGLVGKHFERVGLPLPPPAA